MMERLVGSPAMRLLLHSLLSNRPLKLHSKCFGREQWVSTQSISIRILQTRLAISRALPWYASRTRLNESEEAMSTNSPDDEIAAALAGIRSRLDQLCSITA